MNPSGNSRVVAELLHPSGKRNFGEERTDLKHIRR
jgi:hypothetical protein